MERFCTGDAGAFDALFKRHAAPVRGYLWRLVRDGPLADDLTQTTFLSVTRARGRFIKGARFKPWLYAIATNAARDVLRRRRELTTETGEVLTGDDAKVEAPEPDRGLEKHVRAALLQLPDAQREAIELHRFGGLSFAEIAQSAGVTESAVKVRAHRGYEKLRELLKGVWEK
jgi:RNA polymerase sigma-70 factor (ECF subfamily)